LGVRKYVKDYESKEYIDEKGKSRVELTYVGNYYSYTLNKDKMKFFRIINLVIALSMGILFFVCGMQTFAAQHFVPVIMPYAISIIPVSYNITGAIWQFFVKERMTRKEKDSSYQRMVHSCIGIIVLYGIIVLSDTVYLLIYHDSYPLIHEMLFLLILSIIEAIAVIKLILLRKNPCKRIG